MSRHYSNPERANDKYSLPDVEVWKEEVGECTGKHCGNTYPVDYNMGECPDCSSKLKPTGEQAWWFWYCLPGCLPDSEPSGPYDSEQEAIEAAQE